MRVSFNASRKTSWKLYIAWRFARKSIQCKVDRKSGSELSKMNSLIRLQYTGSIFVITDHAFYCHAMKKSSNRDVIAHKKQATSPRFRSEHFPCIASIFVKIFCTNTMETPCWCTFWYTHSWRPRNRETGIYFYYLGDCLSVLNKPAFT